MKNGKLHGKAYKVEDGWICYENCVLWTIEIINDLEVFVPMIEKKDD